MTFAEAVHYLYGLGNEVLAMKLGLESVSRLAEALGHLERAYPAVHIAGTNGKGSTAAMTDAILRAAGYRSGLYTSPNLVSITERYRIGGDEISEREFARLANLVRAASEQLVADGKLAAPPTFFEQVTMIAYCYFAERKVDAAVLEVGMGGRLDATNICRPVVTAITPIGLDHQQYLGNTLAEIAGEKAGIIKSGIPVVVAPQSDEAMRAIAARAAERNAPLISIATAAFSVEPGDESSLDQRGRYRLRYRDYDVVLGLRGRHQAVNAMTAIHIVEALRQAGWRIERAAVEAGLRDVVWPGRLQWIQLPGMPAPVLLDGAHNPAGAETLRDFLAEYFSQVPITMIFGALGDKPVTEMAGLLFPSARRVILTRIANARAAVPEQIAGQSRPVRQDLICTDGLAEALDAAGRVTPADGLIVVCGSLYLAGELLKLLHGYGAISVA